MTLQRQIQKQWMHIDREGDTGKPDRIREIQHICMEKFDEDA